MYLRYIPKIARIVLPDALYEIPDTGSIYLTFDDGPIPEVTEYVLDTLDVYDARATFFCVGDNVRRYPDIYQKLLEKGHQVGNHTYNHLDGYKTPVARYYKNVLKAGKFIQSRLFRPPYGHITYRQAKGLKRNGYRLVLWSLLSADFDLELSAESIWKYIDKNIKPGDIVVFHDNIKAFEKLKFVLPLLLEKGKTLGWHFKKIDY